jgi:branched-chain amino acid aminotransferase
MTSPLASPPIESTNTTYWYDGRLVDQNEIVIDPFAHALHYGSGVFEGIRSYETARGPGIFRLREHIERLFESAAEYGLEIPQSVDDICRATAETVKASGHKATYIRPLVFFGEGKFALAPLFQKNAVHVMIAVRGFSGTIAPGGEAGCRVTISPVMKTPSKALPSTAKGSGHYTNSIRALHDAMTRGFHEALLLNDRGNVAEGSGENIFLVKAGKLHTNPTSEDVLDGITRRSTIALAQDLGIPVDVAPISTAQLFAADEVFLTGTAAELVPVASVDDHVYSRSHPIADKLHAAYRKATKGEDRKHADWVTYV